MRDDLGTWVEVNCPACGLDVDFPFIGADEEYRCPCGHILTEQDLAAGIVCEDMPEVGRVYTHVNPWLWRIANEKLRST